MTCELYYKLVGAAVKDDDRDAYISDWSLSTTWGDPVPDAEWMQRVETLGRIWDAVHLTIKDIRAVTGKIWPEICPLPPKRRKLGIRRECLPGLYPAAAGAGRRVVPAARGGITCC